MNNLQTLVIPVVAILCGSRLFFYSNENIHARNQLNYAMKFAFATHVDSVPENDKGKNGAPPRGAFQILHVPTTEKTRREEAGAHCPGVLFAVYF
jgi:hypothetical protein